MKQLFSGKRMFFTVPLSIVFSLVFLPFAIAALLGWLVNKKVRNKKVRYASFAGIALFTLMFGTAWVDSMTATNKNGEQQETQQVQGDTQQVDKNASQATKPEEPTAASSVFKAQTAPNNPNLQLAKVVAVVDGDTIDVDLGDGNVKRVRYIGINTPESVDPNRPLECFSKEATAKNKELVENGIVGLEKDVSETDRYKRLLRYVYMGDLFVNQVLVSEGYAYATSYPPDIKYQDTFRQAEQQARNTNKGLWGSCNMTTAPTNTASSNTNNTPSGTGFCKYSCSGADRDCSDFSSHSEAQSFFNCCGFTAQNDPMRLDNVGIGDGIACESLP